MKRRKAADLSDAGRDLVTVLIPVDGDLAESILGHIREARMVVADDDGQTIGLLQCDDESQPAALPRAPTGPPRKSRTTGPANVLPFNPAARRGGVVRRRVSR